MNNKKLVKEMLKTKPLKVLFNPSQWILVPSILSDYFKNRWKNTTVTVLLIENEIDIILDKLQAKKMYKFVEIQNFDDFKHVAVKRIEEDYTTNIKYLKTCEKRFDEGDYATVLYDDEEIVAFSFISESILFAAPVNISLKLPAMTFSYYDVYTFQNHQGKGYYKKLFIETMYLMKNKGFKKVWGMVMEHNQVSVKVHSKLYLNNISKKLIEKVRYGFILHYIQDVDLNLDSFIHDAK